MTKNPFLNALTAALYVTVVASIPFIAFHFPNQEEHLLLGPIVFLSLFTLSAAIMAFIFFYQPIVLISEGKKEEAFKLLVKTIGCFGFVTVSFLVILALVALL